MASAQCTEDLTLAQLTDQQPQLPNYQRHPIHSHPQNDHTRRYQPQSSTSSPTPTTTSQLDLILAKLNELDTIKQHITTLDQRLNLLQPQPTVLGLLAN